MGTQPVAIANEDPAIPIDCRGQAANSALRDLAAIVVRPRCRSELTIESENCRCSNAACRYAAEAFPVVAGQPVLIDFENSLFARADYESGRRPVIKRDDSGRQLRTRIRGAITGDHNRAAPRILGLLLERLRRRGGSPRVLVIGGGAVGLVYPDTPFNRCTRRPMISRASRATDIAGSSDASMKSSRCR